MTIPSTAAPIGDVLSESEVLVIGGGPAGLAAGVDLGTRGIRALVIDEGDGIARFPTAESFDARSMEWMRQHGIAGAQHRDGFPEEYPRDISFVTRLTGYELARFRRPGNRDGTLASDGVTPEGPRFSFDVALRDRADKLPSVAVRYHWRCELLTQDRTKVTATLVRGDGAVRTVTARYALACDGAYSTVRRGLGIPMKGASAETMWECVYAAIPDLLTTTPFKPAVQYYALRPRRAVFSSLNGSDMWRVTYPLNQGEDPAPEDVIATMRDCIGVPDIGITLFDARKCAGHTLVAQSFRKGRVFLAGDAAHQMCQSDVHGMNAGLGDISNLCWKLAAVLGGQAEDTLLDSYETERKPVAERNARRSQRSYQADLSLSTAPVIESNTVTGNAARTRLSEQIHQAWEPVWRSLGMRLGYRNEGSSIVVSEGTAGPPDQPSRCEPMYRPGHQSPDLVLPDGQSTLDLFGSGFVLLQTTRTTPSKKWLASFARLGAALNVADISGADLGERYPAELVLVRPDGVIAWCGDHSDDDVDSIVDTAFGRGGPRASRWSHRPTRVTH